MPRFRQPEEQDTAWLTPSGLHGLDCSDLRLLELAEETRARAESPGRIFAPEGGSKGEPEVPKPATEKVGAGEEEDLR